MPASCIRRCWSGLALIVLCLVSAASQSAAREVRFFQADSRYTYRIQLLELILDKTRDEGPFELYPVYTDVTPERGLALLKSGGLDVVSMPTTQALEHDFRAVPVDILRGMLGYRLLLIRKERQGEFASIHSLAQLRTMSFGFGSQWADLPILQHNQLQVMPAPHYPSLFAMLDKGRFDAFPRGVNEIWQELEERKQTYPDLAVENNLLLYYPYPVFFFVHRDNISLANRLQRGLDIALKDGSMQKLFMQFHASALAKADLDHRRLITLVNPAFPADQAPPDTHWWLPGKLHSQP